MSLINDSFRFIGRAISQRDSVPNTPDTIRVTITNDKITSEVIINGKKASPQRQSGSAAAAMQVLGLLVGDLILGDIIKSNDEDRLTWWDGDCYREAAGLVGKLVSRFPNTRFFGIGNSPSYIIHGINHLSERKGFGIEAKHVPFSKGYLLKDEAASTEQESVFDYPGESVPGPPPIFPWEHDLNKKILQSYVMLNQCVREHSEEYSHYLTQLGLHPREIVGRYNETRQRTAIVDNAQYGGNLASFLHFMYSWAEMSCVEGETFSKALLPIALVDEKFAQYMSFPLEGVKPRIHRVSISENFRLAINGNLSKERDRFVPPYSPNCWGEKPQWPRTCPSIVQEIMAGVERAVDSKNIPSPRCYRPVRRYGPGKYTIANRYEKES